MLLLVVQLDCRRSSSTCKLTRVIMFVLINFYCSSSVHLEGNNNNNININSYARCRCRAQLSSARLMLPANCNTVVACHASSSLQCCRPQLGITSIQLNSPRANQRALVIIITSSSNSILVTREPWYQLA